MPATFMKDDLEFFSRYHLLLLCVKLDFISRSQFSQVPIPLLFMPFRPIICNTFSLPEYTSMFFDILFTELEHLLD
jgi:hypothetical protein